MKRKNHLTPTFGNVILDALAFAAEMRCRSLKLAVASTAAITGQSGVLHTFDSLKRTPTDRQKNATDGARVALSTTVSASSKESA